MAKKVEKISKHVGVEKVRYFDYGLLMVIIMLIAFGLLMLYSSSSYTAALEFNDPAYFLKRQLFPAILGLGGMTFFTFWKVNTFKRLANLLYVISIVLNVAVVIFGMSQGGSTRWLNILGFNFQPSEISKVAVIVFLACYINENKESINSFKTLLNAFLFLLPTFLLVAISNLSTAIIIFIIAYVMMFIANKHYLIFVIVALVGVIGGLLFIFLVSYRATRIAIWLDPVNHPQGGQVIQGLYAIGSGGLFGKGLGESIQKQGFIPEAQNDMIFSIICEELGVLGAVCIIVMYLLLLWRLIVIATNSKSLFGSFMVVGIIIHISIQVILNIAVVTNTIPNTGVTLPFISYGGTSISILIAEMGLALSVSREIYLR